MNEEVLYAENLVTHLNNQKNLDYVSFYLRRGEILGITGLNGSGISTLGDVLAGRVRLQSGTVYLDGRPVALDSGERANAAGIYEVRDRHATIDTLSVAENLSVLRRGSWKSFIVRKRRNLSTTQSILTHYQIGGNPAMLAGRMTNRQRIELSICRAILCGARVLICRDVGDGFAQEDTRALKAFFHQIRNEGIPIVMISADVRRLLDFADRIAVMRSGMICYSHPTEGISPQILYRCLERTQEVATPPGPPAAPGGALLRVEALLTPENRRHPITADLYAGSTVGLLWENHSIGDLTLRIFSGQTPASGFVADGDTRIPFARWQRKNRDNILCLGIRFWENQLYEHMTVGENLALRTYSRYNSRGGIFNAGMLRLALREFARAQGIAPACLGQYPRHLPPELRNQIVLWGVLFVRPAFLVMDNPLYAADENIRNSVVRCVAALKSAGSSILWSNNNRIALETYCDRIVTVEFVEEAG